MCGLYDPAMGGNRGWWGAAVAVVLLVGLTVIPAPSARVGTSQADQDSSAAVLPADRPPPPDASDSPLDRPSGGAAVLVARRAAEVGALLARRAAAIRRRDLTEFTADLDPGGDPRFRAAQRTMFDNLGAVGELDSARAELAAHGLEHGVRLADWTYELSPDEVVDAPAPTSLATPPDELWAPAVRLHYALAGGDVAPTTRPMGYLFARRGSQWYLTADDQLDGAGRSTWRGPWDFGPCDERRTGSGIVLSHPGADVAADRVARELDAAVRAVTEVWGPDWPQRVTVLQPASLPELRAVVGSRFATDGIAGVAVADRVDRATRRVEGARVILNPDTTAALSDTAIRVVLRHEITHVAARSSTVDGSPMWLLEGFADYVGYRDSGMPLDQAAPNLTRLIAAEGPPPDLPANLDFQSTGGRLELAYQLSRSVSLYIAQLRGERALVALYRRLAAAGVATNESVDAALRAELGIDRTAFLRGWQDYLRRTF